MLQTKNYIYKQREVFAARAALLIILWQNPILIMLDGAMIRFSKRRARNWVSKQGS